MAKYIPYTQDNMFLWYEGNDPDRATPFNGVNLNMPLKQLEQNDEKLDETIQSFADGELVASHLKTIDLDVNNTLKLNSSLIKNSSSDIFFTDSSNNNNITLNSYKINTSKINLNSANLDYSNETLTITDSNGNYKNIKIQKVEVSEIDFTNIDSRINVQNDSSNNVDYLDFKTSEGYDQSFIRTGAFYAINSYYNFGSKDLKDAIVYDDDSSGNTPKSFLFYADGEIKNSTIYTGDVKTVGADIAEYYESDRNYEEGIVLEVGGEKEVTIYNGGTLAGVVSKNPGYYLNEDNNFDNKVLLALKGRIKCKISNKAKKGDIIIADKNGKGKAIKRKDLKFEDQVIGIALEDGKDKILIKV